MLADVVVVGAGPAGVTVGGQIASAGFDVLIIEKNQSPGKNKACGGAVTKGCFMELDLPKEIIEKESRKIVIHFENERYEVPSKSGCILFDREKLDQTLALKATKNGARLITSAVVYDVTRSDNEIVLRFKKLPQGEIAEAKARLVVFADGTKTLAREKMGIGFPLRPDCTAVAATYDLRWPKNPLDSLDFFVSEEISPFGYGWIFPKKDSANVGVVCLRSKMKQDIKHYLDRFKISQKLDSREVIRYGSRLTPQSMAKKIHSDSVLVVGDAAGTADPLTGAGISNAIINAKIAAEVAIKALEARKPTADLLASYESKWKETSNYKNILSSCRFQRIALKTGINYAFFLRLSTLL
jgi:digeranylgeranylglycerophospholipid reductase